MKKLILSTAVIAAVSAGMSTSANADMAADAMLNFDTGVTGGYYGFVTGGSYFAMDTDGGGFTKSERVAIAQNEGLYVNATQAASGSHSGAPGCDPSTDDGVTVFCNGGLPLEENPGIDQAWNFFGNTGFHETKSVTTLGGSGDSATLDFSGWTVDWNGGEISMGAGASGGVGTVVCAAGSGCAAGSTYTLDYFATVPATDPGFGGVAYLLHLEGTIGTQPPAFPVPAAVWLFGSGLLGLVGVARRRKAA